MQVTVFAVDIQSEVLAFAYPDILVGLHVKFLVDFAVRGQLHGKAVHAVTLVALGLENRGEGQRSRVGHEGQRTAPGEHAAVNLGGDDIIAVFAVHGNETFLGSYAVQRGLGQDSFADFVGAQHILTGSQEGVIAHQSGGENSAEGQVEVTSVERPGRLGSRKGRHGHGIGRYGIQIFDLVNRGGTLLGAGEHQGKADNQ